MKPFPIHFGFVVLSVLGFLAYSEARAQNTRTYSFESEGIAIGFESADILKPEENPSAWNGINSASIRSISAYGCWQQNSGRTTWVYDVAHFSLNLDESPSNLAEWLGPWVKAATDGQDCVQINNTTQAIRFMGQGAVQLDYTSSSGSECAPNELLYHRVVAFRIQNSVRLLVVTCRKDKWNSLKTKLEKIQLSFHYVS